MADPAIRVEHGDSREVLKTLAADSVDACVTDPPYALTSIRNRFGKVSEDDDTQTSRRSRSRVDAYTRTATGFMNKTWDTEEVVHDPAFWREVYRVLKPGAHLVAFGGTRTYHRMVCAIEDAGFEIRDQLAWLFGTGFPKSHDVSKGIDRKGGNPDLTRELATALKAARTSRGISVTKADRMFCGGTTLYSWYEGRPVGIELPTSTYMRKIADAWPEMEYFVGLTMEAERDVLSSSVRTKIAVASGQGKDRPARSLDVTAPATDAAKQWQGWGTALKPAHEPIVLARKPISESSIAANVLRHGTGAINVDGCRIEATDNTTKEWRDRGDRPRDQYRTGTSGRSVPTDLGRWPANVIHDGSDEVVSAFPDETRSGHIPLSGDSKAFFGNAAQPITTESNNAYGDSGSAARFFFSAKADVSDRLSSKHPTVKPLDLMRWLVTLVTPPGGVVLDPFAGTGTTGIAARASGFGSILIERDAQYIIDIQQRIEFYGLRGKKTRSQVSKVYDKLF